MSNTISPVDNYDGNIRMAFLSEKAVRFFDYQALAIKVSIAAAVVFIGIACLIPLSQIAIDLFAITEMGLIFSSFYFEHQAFCITDALTSSFNSTQNNRRKICLFLLASSVAAIVLAKLI